MGMSSNKKGGGYQPIADINVTPLVDVMLVLLIIFMITAPLLATGVKINLPQGSAAKPLDPQDPAVVTVTKTGELHLGDDIVSREALANAVKAKLQGDLSRPVHLRGDKDANYGTIVSIMNLLATNGIVKIAIVSDKQSRASDAENGVPSSAGVPAPPAASAASAPSPVPPAPHQEPNP